MWAVRFEHVSKRYRKGGARYSTLGGELSELSRRLRERARGRAVEPIGTLALDDVSFEVAEGESFALLGANGAGKTTALRLLARISPPTQGSVHGRGRVGALMEVGSGVHTELTGRENVWLYGSILGIPRRELRRRFDEIVNFAELEDSIDTQVKYYSSGMQLRLGFSIAAHLEPDIFVVDEALAVGDANFQAKCVDRMSKLVRGGTTVLFVSHSLNAIESVCERGLLLDRGAVVTQGAIHDVLARYLEFMEDRHVDFEGNERNRGPVRITSATFHALDGTEQHRFDAGAGMEIRMRFEADEAIDHPMLVIAVDDGRPWPILECSMLEDGRGPAVGAKRWECRLVVDTLPLRPRLYSVDCSAFDPTGRVPLMQPLEIGTFRVVSTLGSGPQAIAGAAQGGPVQVPYRWYVDT
jgi:ABC-type polysaccharide/polyol phosphate transport system ATPase subunit